MMAGILTNYGQHLLDEAFAITLASEWDPIRVDTGRIAKWVPSERLVQFYEEEGLVPPWERA